MEIKFEDEPIKAEDGSRVKSLLIEKKQNLENMLAKYAELVRIENVANNDYNARQEEYEHLQEKRVQTATKKANICKNTITYICSLFNENFD